ncbi:MAG: Insertion element protein [Actinomycetes bacterium]
MSARFPVQYCPYCSDADLFPEEAEAWRCRACLRWFTVRAVPAQPGVKPPGVKP